MAVTGEGISPLTPQRQIASFPYPYWQPCDRLPPFSKSTAISASDDAANYLLTKTARIYLQRQQQLDVISVAAIPTEESVIASTAFIIVFQFIQYNLNPPTTTACNAVYFTIHRETDISTIEDKTLRRAGDCYRLVWIVNWFYTRCNWISRARIEFKFASFLSNFLSIQGTKLYSIQ